MLGIIWFVLSSGSTFGFLKKFLGGFRLEAITITVVALEEDNLRCRHFRAGLNQPRTISTHREDVLSSWSTCRSYVCNNKISSFRIWRTMSTDGGINSS